MSSIGVKYDVTPPDTCFHPGPVWGCDRLVSRAKVIKNQVMAAMVISISSDVSVESVRSSFLRVILIGSNSVKVPVAPEVGAAVVASPVGVLELDTHSSSEADPSESSPPPVSVAPMILTAPILPAPSAVVAPSSEFPLTPVDAPPKIPLRYTSHHLDRFTSGSSSSHSSSDHSSFGHSISGHSLLTLPPPDTTVADSSTPPRFVHPPLARTPWCSEAYLRWRSAPLSTMYPPTTSKSSAGDSSFESSARPSRKRCRSPAATMSSSIHATRALKVDTRVLAYIEADARLIRLPDEVAVDRDVEAGVDAGIDMEVDVGVDVEDKVEDEVEDEVESSDRGTMKVEVDVVAGIDILDEIPLQRIEDIEMRQRELEARSLIAGGERASLLEQVAPLERSNARLRGTMMMERARADRQSKNSLTDEWKKRWLLMRRPVLQMLSRLKVKAKTVVMAIMEMVEMEMEMVEMEMVEMEMVEMEIQMRIIGVLGLLLESVHTKTS
ncbi:hypothetical protein Tco_0596665 [Tanacetum coccineum]